MAKVSVGMSKTKALELLGPPDDVRTKHDPGGCGEDLIKEILRYGTSGHLTTATLGSVYIAENDLVRFVHGAGTPPSDMFTEPELRRLLIALDYVPSFYAGWNYNPRRLIAAVNLLQPLGKEKALAAIEEYLRVTRDDGDGMILLLRTLFEVPDKAGHMIPVYGGPWSARGPVDKKLLPRFPISIEGDIPLILVEGYNIGGALEDPKDHLAYFRANGTVRSKPLKPMADPLAAIDEFMKSPRWIFKDFDADDRWSNFMRIQVLNLVHSVYRVEPDEHGDRLPYGPAGADRRSKILSDISALKIHWDGATQKYVFADGSSLPEVKPKQYRRELWKPGLGGRDIEVVIERDGPKRVSVWVVDRGEIGKTSSNVRIKAFGRAAKDVAPIEFSSGTRVEWRPLLLGEGLEMQIEARAGETLKLSPVYRP